MIRHRRERRTLRDMMEVRFNPKALASCAWSVQPTGSEGSCWPPIELPGEFGPGAHAPARAER